MGGDAQTIKYVPVALYGVRPEHHIQCQEMMYPPNIKSNIPQTLGAGAAIISLIRNNGIYKDKWKSVVKRHISHLPDADNIMGILESARSAAEIAPLVSIVLDILNITTSRTVNRAFLPMGILVCLVSSERFAECLGKNILNLKGEFSGTDAVDIYNNGVTHGLKYKCATARGGAQIVFHGVWRTKCEDLDLFH